MPTYEINREIVFSTAHITHGESQKLDKDGSATGHDIIVTITVDRYEFGYRIWTGQDDTNFQHAPHIHKLIEVAREQDCKWLILDCDGPMVDGLPLFDW